VNNKIVNSTKKNLRVISVIPGEGDKNSMIFAKRQIEYLTHAGVINRTFFLLSRTSPLKVLKEFIRLRNEIRTFKPDIIHAHYGTVTGFLSSFASNIPVIITFRGSDLNRNKENRFFRWALGHLFSQISALKAKKIICVSEDLKKKLWLRKQQVAVLPTGVDTLIFAPKDRNEARLELGWEIDRRFVLFNAGKHPKAKSLDLAELSINIAKKIIGEISFIVLDGTVNPNKVPTLMNAADCLLLTSDKEGSPTVVQEAIACNLPVVSVAVGDVKERLSSVIPSAIVKRDPDNIAKALVELLASPRRSNGRDHLREISLENITKQIVSVYHEISGQ
jgi:glycosyltransferase involved in cell wall biosynthesis